MLYDRGKTITDEDLSELQRSVSKIIQKTSLRREDFLAEVRRAYLRG